MREYPHIAGSNGQSFRRIADAYVFDKLDGSNLRFEWSRNRGWHKSGTRDRRFDETDPDFGEAMRIFAETWTERIEKIARKERWLSAVFYCEFWGAQSFAGVHVPGDPKHLTLFDVAADKKGLLVPREFLKLFGRLEPPLVPRFLGQYNWTRGFAERVRSGEFMGPTFEGVVGKSGANGELVMAKAKTQKWIDAV